MIHNDITKFVKIYNQLHIIVVNMVHNQAMYILAKINKFVQNIKHRHNIRFQNGNNHSVN